MGNIDLQKIRVDGIVIAFMGPTGSGKSNAPPQTRRPAREGDVRFFPINFFVDGRRDDGQLDMDAARGFFEFIGMPDDFFRPHGTRGAQGLDQVAMAHPIQSGGNVGTVDTCSQTRVGGKYSFLSMTSISVSTSSPARNPHQARVCQGKGQVWSNVRGFKWSRKIAGLHLHFERNMFAPSISRSISSYWKNLFDGRIIPGYRLWYFRSALDANSENYPIDASQERSTEFLLHISYSTPQVRFHWVPPSILMDIPDRATITLGPPTTTLFCPNPHCRFPFYPSTLSSAASHFNNDTPCGIWLASVTSARTFEVCPNHNCQLRFDSQDDAVTHLMTDGSACSVWYQQLCLQQLPANTGIPEDIDKNAETDDQDVYAYATDIASEEIEEISGLFEDDGDIYGSAAYTDQRDNGPQDHDTYSYEQWVAGQPSGTPSIHMSRTGLPPSARVQFHPNRPWDKHGGVNILQAIDVNADAQTREKRAEFPYFPFADRLEWELGAWLMNGGLSMRDIDQFLKLDITQRIKPSFTSAQVLRARMESLPAVPAWRYQEISVRGYPTTTKLFLYWRDGLDVVKHLFANPLFAECLQMTPYRAYDLESGRMWGEFMSGDVAWEEQDRLPEGHAVVGVIGASDKTTLTFGTGGKEMHPFLLSIANVEANVRMKATSHAFALAAYLPIPKFRNVSKTVQAILSARVYHFCLDLVTQSLKVAADPSSLTIASNPWGGLNAIHTPLVSFIADHPEQLLVSCTASKNSPVTTATADEFGDNYPHPCRTREITLRAIERACSEADPWDLQRYYKASQRQSLNGVYKPFWADWGQAEPSLFLTPDALHLLHKFFFDHPLKWVANIMTGEELDYRLTSLQPRVGSRQWPQGVSTLKQCTGRDHRAMETLLVAVAAGGVPDRVLSAIRALVDFIFQAQNVYHYDETLHALEESLREFHCYKQSIITAGGRKGKNGPLDHFRIPKLEMMQSIVRNIRAMGAAFQWTSDMTERCHVVLVKRPYRLSNRRDFHSQCCRFLDREEKIRLFSLYTAVKTAESDLLQEMHWEANEMSVQYPDFEWISHGLLPNELLFQSPSRVSVPLFERRHSKVSSDETTAFLLTKTPHQRNIPIDDASQLFHLPDLRPALGDYFSVGRSFAVRGGARESSSNCSLPFTHINIWQNVRLQQHSAQDSRCVTPIQTVVSLAPSDAIPYGRYDTVVVDFEDEDRDETSGIVEVRLIFEPIMPSVPSRYLLFYANFFKIISSEDPPSPAPFIEMFVLRRHRRSNGSPMGDIMALSTMRHQVQLVPKHGQFAPRGLDANNSMYHSEVFHLNNYAHKETFHAILAYH